MRTVTKSRTHPDCEGKRKVQWNRSLPWVVWNGESQIPSLRAFVDATVGFIPECKLAASFLWGIRLLWVEQSRNNQSAGLQRRLSMTHVNCLAQCLAHAGSNRCLSHTIHTCSVYLSSSREFLTLSVDSSGAWRLTALVLSMLTRL